tara:strand:- start:412 stop:516 length:105 start_codon:yes stop_codon:yes gene_type:complete
MEEAIRNFGRTKEGGFKETAFTKARIKVENEAPG